MEIKACEPFAEAVQLISMKLPGLYFLLYLLFHMRIRLSSCSLVSGFKLLRLHLIWSSRVGIVTSLSKATGSIAHGMNYSREAVGQFGTQR